MSLPDLRRRVAVITGASRGIGAGLAADFAVRGMRLGLCARTDCVLPEGPDVVSRRTDVTAEKSVAEFVARVEERLGGIDLWINNAGILSPIAKLVDIEVGEFRRHVEINLTGVFLGTRAYVRHLHARGQGGVLINMSSGAAWKGYAGWSPYCASKAGVELLTASVRLEEAERGLRAHAVAPGVVDTDMQAEIRASSEESFPELPRFVEMKRDDAFNSTRFVSQKLLELAFDPSAATDEVSIRLPREDES